MYTRVRFREIFFPQQAPLVSFGAFTMVGESRLAGFAQKVLGAHRPSLQLARAIVGAL